jgi:hypothetical protein
MTEIKDNVKRILISDDEKNRIKKLYSIKQNNIIKSPLFENNNIIVRQKTLHNILLNEKLTTSDVLHSLGDISSMITDFVLPGSGAIIDTINGFSYFIEAQFIKDEKQKNSLYLMGTITLGFVILPGLIQGPFILLKNTIKAGKKIKPGPQLEALKVIDKQLPNIFGKSTKLITWILTKPLGKTKLGKFAKQLPDILNKADVETQRLVKEIIGESAEVTAKKADVKATKELLKGAEAEHKLAKNLVKISKANLKLAKSSTKLTTVERNAIFNFLKKMPKLQKPIVIIRKMGFIEGKTYKILINGKVTNVSITKMGNDKIFYRVIDDTKGTVNKLNMMTPDAFINSAIISPMRRFNKAGLPLLSKMVARILLPDGSGIDETKLDQLPDANPDDTAQELENALGDTTTNTQTTYTSQYKSANGVYNINTYSPNNDIARMQNLLNNPPYEYRDENGNPLKIDNKFGPKTMDALQKNNLQTTDITTEYINQLIQKTSAQQQATQQQAVNNQKPLKLQSLIPKVKPTITTNEPKLASIPQITPAQERELLNQKIKDDEKLKKVVNKYNNKM